LANRTCRACLNAAYRGLTLDQQATVHARFAKLFRERGELREPGFWTVRFAGRRVRMPLRPFSMWLDWDNAVSLSGHDIEVKKTYLSLLGSRRRPELFLDIGANYGTHSLLFLVHGVDTIAF